MKLFAGIDGGQSSTVAIVADERGRVLGRGQGGPADEVGQNAKSTRLRDAIEGALANAVANATLPQGVRFESVVAGISGYDGKVRGLAPRVKAKHLRLTHDAPIAHAGALGGRSGIIVIAGTGSAVYGVAHDGRTLTLGGWGYLFGDEGSAFWIARNSVNAAMQDQDRDRVTPLWEAACDFFGVRSLRDVQAGLAAGTLSRDRIAAFARRAIADSDDERVAEILAVGTTALSRLAEVAARRLGFTKRYRLALAGGLAKSERYLEQFAAACRAGQLAAQVNRAEEEPVMGALRMSMG